MTSRAKDYNRMSDAEKREYLRAKGNPLLRISRGLEKAQQDKLKKKGIK